MDNGDGSTVYAMAGPEATVPNYNYDETAVLGFVKDVHAKTKSCTISEISLLDFPSYVAAKDVLPASTANWWIKPSGANGGMAAYVSPDGRLNFCGSNSRIGVRPVVSLSAGNFKEGDKIDLLGHCWTVFQKSAHESLALCDEIIAYRAFDKNFNDYQTSDLKAFLNKWLEKKLKEFQHQKPLVISKFAPSLSDQLEIAAKRTTALTQTSGHKGERER